MNFIRHNIKEWLDRLFPDGIEPNQIQVVSDSGVVVVRASDRTTAAKLIAERRSLNTDLIVYYGDDFYGSTLEETALKKRGIIS